MQPVTVGLARPPVPMMQRISRRAGLATVGAAAGALRDVAGVGLRRGDLLVARALGDSNGSGVLLHVLRLRGRAFSIDLDMACRKCRKCRKPTPLPTTMLTWTFLHFLHFVHRDVTWD
jgi:hypothetical protein